MEVIANFFLEKLMTDVRYGSSKPVDDQLLLLPAFLEKLKVCIGAYQEKYPAQTITFTETYRSNVLQQKYYQQGASKIKADGMHHYGIATDSIFVINGKRTYKGDVMLLRNIYVDNGLTILGMWDALHVQLIPVDHQTQLRNAVIDKIKSFQNQHDIPVTGLADAVTIDKARTVFS